MLSDEEKKAIDILINEIADIVISEYCTHCKICENEDTECYYTKVIDIVYNLVQKQSKEIEELKETLKCTQNSWYEDTQEIEEMKKQIDLDNECEIALNNRIMDLENADKKWEDKIKAKIEEVKDGTFDAKIVLQSLLEKE